MTGASAPAFPGLQGRPLLSDPEAGRVSPAWLTFSQRLTGASRDPPLMPFRYLPPRCDRVTSPLPG